MLAFADAQLLCKLFAFALLVVRTSLARQCVED